MTHIQNPRVLVIGNVFLDTPEFVQFQKRYSLAFYKVTSKEGFVRDMREKFADVDALWLAHGGLICASGTITVSGDVLDCLPARLRVIALSSVGYDRYDGAALRERGILLTHTPSIASDQVADTALLLALNSFRLFPIFERAVRESHDTVRSRINVTGDAFGADGFPARPAVPEPFQLGDYVGGMNVYTPKGRTVGIVGLGAIGEALAVRLNAIGMRIRYTKRTPTTTQLPFATTHHASLEEMLPHCDLLVLCCPLTPETHHLVNRSTLGLCRQGVRLINVGRGACVNEEHLVEALESGQVGYAGLDVYEHEPQIHPGLLKRWNVCLLPHIGNATVDNRMISAINCMANIDNVLNGGPGLTPAV